MTKRSFFFVLLTIWNALPGASGPVELWPSGREHTTITAPPLTPSLQSCCLMSRLRNTHSRPPHSHSSCSSSFHPFFAFSQTAIEILHPWTLSLLHLASSICPFQTFNQHLVYTHADSVLAFRHHTGAAEEFSDRCLLMLSHTQTHTRVKSPSFLEFLNFFLNNFDF